MKKIIQPLLAFLLLPAAVLAQKDKAAFTPLNPENEVAAKLFRLQQDDVNYRFTIELPHKNYLLIEFRRLSDWRDNGAIDAVMHSAADIAKRYDTAAAGTGSRTLEVHLPIKNEPVTARLRSNAENDGLRIFSGGNDAPLKIGMDTVCVLKNFAEYKDDEGKMKKAQVQYTLLLKDLKEMQDVYTDGNWQQAGLFVDSVVKAYRSRWHSQDAWYHSLYISYDMTSGNTKPAFISTRRDEKDRSAFGKVVNVDESVGVSLMRSDFSPTLEIGLRGILDHSQNGDIFLRLSFNGIFTFDRQADNKVKVYETPFMNLEIGSTSGENSTWPVPYYSFSAGAGIKLRPNEEYRDPTLDDDLYRVFLRYGFTKAINVTCDAYLGPHTRSWIGMSLNVRFL